MYLSETETAISGQPTYVFGLHEFADRLGIPDEGQPVEVRVAWPESAVIVVMSDRVKP